MYRPNRELLLIYLEAELQTKLIPLFFYSLNPGGFLFLGSAENMHGDTELFTPIEGPGNIFRRSSSPLTTKLVDFTNSFSTLFKGIYPQKISESQKNIADSTSSLVEQLILKEYAPVSVLTNPQGDIVYINGRTGQYLEPISGKANWNIFVMARDAIKYSLSRAFESALRTQKKVSVQELLDKNNRESVEVEISVSPIKKPEQLSGMFLFVFTQKCLVEKSTIKEKPGSDKPLPPDQLALAEELQSLRSELLATHENMLTSQEELKSMNEELLSANEELQSTNEELSTAKEEMQSLNEELQTVNQELQGKLDELGRTSDDMKNLLNSTEIATLFLDEQLNVRSFTKALASISKFTAIDKGRPFSDIASTLNYPELRDDALAVLDTLVFKEKQISTTDDRWFLIRIMPYCTRDNRINGLVITFIDITLSKKLEIKLFDVEKQFMLLFSQMPTCSFFLSKEGTISKVNPAAERFFRLREPEMAGHSFRELDIKLLSEDGLDFAPDREPFTQALSTGTPLKGVIIGFSSLLDQRCQWTLADVVPQFYEDNRQPHLLCVLFEEIGDPKIQATISQTHR